MKRTPGAGLLLVALLVTGSYRLLAAQEKTATDSEQALTVAFSPNGRMVAVAGYATTVLVWDARAGNLLRSLEVFLQKHPDTVQRPDIELTLAKASIDAKDDRRIVLYGERVLSRTRDDVLMLDRVSQSLLALGGQENAEKAIKYARTLEDLIDGMGQASGAGAAQKQEDRDRAR